MNLPWFPIYIDSYCGDTMHLTTEEHGAYLLMMFAYYRTEKPLPASDRNLAALTKLTMERWLEAKPTLAAFFREEAGHWVHDRIEAELQERRSKHAASIAKAQLAGKARWAKNSQTDAPSTASSMPQASTKKHRSIKHAQSNASSNAPSMPEASDEQCSKDAHLHLHLSLNREGERAGAREGSPPEDRDGTWEGPTTAAPDLTAALGRTLPADWEPPLATKAEFSVPDAEWHDELAKFRYHHTARGTMARDWAAAWGTWLMRWKSRREADAAKAPPRVDLSPPVDWDAMASRWAKFGTWTRGYGPSPGQSACRCPSEILRKHGIDPESGEVKREAVG